MSESEIVARKRTALYEIIEERDRLRAILEKIVDQLNCPARNTTMTSYRRDGSVIISEDLRQEARAALAGKDERPAMTVEQHNAFPKGRW